MYDNVLHIFQLVAIYQYTSLLWRVTVVSSKPFPVLSAEVRQAPGEVILTSLSFVVIATSKVRKQMGKSAFSTQAGFGCDWPSSCVAGCESVIRAEGQRWGGGSDFDFFRVRLEQLGCCTGFLLFMHCAGIGITGHRCAESAAPTATYCTMRSGGEHSRGGFLPGPLDDSCRTEWRGSQEGFYRISWKHFLPVLYFLQHIPSISLWRFWSAFVFTGCWTRFSSNPQNHNSKEFMYLSSAWTFGDCQVLFHFSCYP